MVQNTIRRLKANNNRRSNHEAAEIWRLEAEYRRLRNMAADATFRKFNPPGVWGQGHGTPSDSVQRGEPDELRLDLHHLSVHEAKAKLLEHLPAAAAAVRERNKNRSGRSLWVVVVVGAGTHSVGPPKLEEAVNGWLVGWRVQVQVRARGVLEADANTVPAAIST